MATPKEIEGLADLLSAPSNTDLFDTDLATRVWEFVEKQRRRPYKYVIIGQERSKPTGSGRRFHPTWVRGPFYTAAEAGVAARAERKLHPDSHVMSAQVFTAEQLVDPDTLEETLA